MIKTIIFDLDGTLCYAPKRNIILAQKAMLKSMIESGLPVDSDKIDFNKFYIIPGLNVANYFINKYNINNKSILEAGLNTYYNFSSPVELFENSKKVLNTLKNIKNYRLILLTTGDPKKQKVKLEQLGIIDYFSEIVYDNFQNSDKEKEIKKILKEYNLNPEEVISIGDKFSDIEASNKAGTTSVHLLTKRFDGSKPKDDSQKPDYIIKDIGQLLKIVKNKDYRSKIVTIGGGTGTYQVLRGLKGSEITAIVSMADNGGSSGVLRDEFGILPPGDIRKSIIALSESPEMMKKIFSHRFSKGTIKGHNLGNLIIAALSEITGSEDSAIKEAGKILNIKGNVLPVTLDNSNLCAELIDGRIIRGETNIDVPKHDPNLRIKRVFLEPEARVYSDCLDAIDNADIILLGPGDLYTSIIPNLIVNGLSEAIRKSSARKVYFCNIMTKYGETNRFKASDFFLEIEKYLGKDIIDYFIVNSAVPPLEILLKYGSENSELVKDDTIKLKNRDVNIIKADLLNKSDILRHDPDKIKKLVKELFNL